MFPIHCIAHHWIVNIDNIGTVGFRVNWLFSSDLLCLSPLTAVCDAVCRQRLEWNHSAVVGQE